VALAGQVALAETVVTVRIVTKVEEAAAAQTAAARLTVAPLQISIMVVLAEAVGMVARVALAGPLAP
jgi:hypothetical protein